MLKRLITSLFPQLADEPGRTAPVEVRAEAPVAPVSMKATEKRGIVLGGPGIGHQGDTLPYPVPFKIENRHFLIGGTPGSGKTRLFFQIADQARDRGDKAFVIDHGGEQIKRQWRPGDIILNPWDERWPGWSVFAECRDDSDFDALSTMIVPDGVGPDASWHSYAQNLVAAVMRRIAEDETGVNNRCSADIIKWIAVAELEALHAFVEGDPIAGMVNPKSGRMVYNIKSTASKFLAPWRYMADHGADGGQFSIRDWVSNPDDRRWVFVTYKESQFGAVRSLISCWLSIAITFALDLAEDETRRIWFFLDELGSLDKINALSDALTKVRKRGGCVVAGLQALSQLIEPYDKIGAQTLMSCFGTWIALKVGDANTAEEFSRHFGEQEIWQQGFNEGMSHGADKASLSDGASLQLKRQRIVEYTDLMRLEDLHGYIKFPLDLPIGEITCPIIAPPKNRGAEPFIPRANERAQTFDLELSK